MSELLIKGGTVIDGTGSPRYEADILVEDGKIKAVDTGLGTSQAARWIGLSDRGVVGEGMVADLALFDLDHLECLPKEQNSDLPGGETRWVQRAAGVEGVLVAGTSTILQGRETGDLPGRVIRGTE